MPRPFGGTYCANSALKSDLAKILSCSAAALAAFALSLTLISSPTLAAGDEGSDTTIGADDNSEAEGGAGAAVPSKTGSAAGGLTVEGLVYRRSGLKTVPFTELGDSPNFTAGTTTYVKFDTSDLEGEDYAPGLRVSLQATMLDQPIELSAFFVAPFRVDQTKLGLSVGSTLNTDAVYANPTGTDVFPASADSRYSDDIYGMTVHHESKVYGGEANATSLFGIPGLSVGARAIYFGEVLSSTTLDDTDAVTIPPPSGSTGFQHRDRATVRTDNRLVGLQLGLEHMFDVGDDLRVGGSIKGGLYNNFVDRNRTFVAENFLNTQSFEATDHKNVFAQGVEFNPRIEVKLAEGTYLTASGQFLWLNNVSTALPNYETVANLKSDHDVRADNDVYFYGGSLGLTVDLDQSSPTSNSLPFFASSYSAAEAVESGDIDARIAQLEDTTARKGNSRVSLAVSGWINRMLLAWDDGDERDVYVVDNTASRSRINFEGAAQISRGWSAGYFLSLGLDNASSNDVDQFVINDDFWDRGPALGVVGAQQPARHGHARVYLDGDRQYHPEGRRRHHAGRSQHRHDRRQHPGAACRSVRSGR